MQQYWYSRVQYGLFWPPVFLNICLPGIWYDMYWTRRPLLLSVPVYTYHMQKHHRNYTPFRKKHCCIVITTMTSGHQPPAGLGLSHSSRRRTPVTTLLFFLRHPRVLALIFSVGSTYAPHCLLLIRGVHMCVWTDWCLRAAVLRE